ILRGVRQQQDEPGRFSICSRQAAVVQQAKDFAERAFTLDAVAYPAKMQYERLQQLANIAEGLGDNAQARRYRQMSFRHRMAHSIYPGDPQYNDFAKPGGDRCG
ncbi:hypothetical protein NPY90_22455, partial [Salmonella enterica]|nr:hypothetical protein [Salmonella enterica]